MKRYKEYKNSGIEWIGEIPRHWSTIPMNALFSEEKRTNEKLERTLALKFSAGRIVPKPERWDFEEIRETYAKYSVVDPDTLVINNLNLNFDLKSQRVGMVKQPGIITSAYVSIVPNNQIAPRFAEYSMKNWDFKKAFHNMGRGLRSTLDWSELKHYKTLLPLFKEQEAIANYLDTKTAEIDRLVEQTEKSIELLEEYRKAIISEAVTEGLDSDVPTKDSGIEWIDEIPEHWKIARVKQICSKIADGTHFSPKTSDDGYPYITASDVRGYGVDYSSAKKVPRDEYEKLAASGCRAFKGDVLLVKDGATTGRVGMMIDNENCVLLSSVAMLSVNNSGMPAFLMYQIQSHLFQNQIIRSMAGSAMPRITLEKLSEYVVVWPPVADQAKIISYLNEQIANIDFLISKKEELILNLTNYRKSLIFEAVTGKFKVPGVE